MQEYDCIVIGSGSAAGKPAYAAAQKGRDVAIIDSKPFGGTCSLRGCMPKKVFVAAARHIEAANSLADHGVACKDLDVDWSAVQEFKTSFTTAYQQGSEQGYEDAGIDLISGRASFVDSSSVDVEGERLYADRFVIATGMKPRPLNFPGSEHLITSDEFLELEEIPDTITFVGGGYIGFESAHIAARAGADVTLLQRDDRPLKMFDHDVIETLLEASDEAGIDVRLNSEADKVEKEDDKLVVHCTDSEYHCTADLVVHSAGRVPAVDDLELDKANVTTDRGGVVVDATLQTDNSDIYAAGDCASTDGPPLTPVATMEGEAVAENLVEDGDVTPDYTGIPSALYSIPPVAGVGVLPDDADESVTVHQGDMSDWFSSEHIGVDHAYYKIVLKDGMVEGAHLIGPNADELINVFALAIKHEIPAEELYSMPWSFPTVTSDISSML